MTGGERWLLCPLCERKTRIRLLPETVLQSFPLFCPKCRRETLVHVRDGQVQVIQHQPDAKTQC